MIRIEKKLLEVDRLVNKLDRLLAKLAQKHTDSAEEIEIGMHAVMQIGKILPQCLQELGELQAGQEDYVDTGIQEGFSESGLNSIDVAMDSAMRNIQGFKTATQNLTGKINVLLNQASKVRKVSTLMKTTNNGVKNKNSTKEEGRREGRQHLEGGQLLKDKSRLHRGNRERDARIGIISEKQDQQANLSDIEGSIEDIIAEYMNYMRANALGQSTHSKEELDDHRRKVKEKSRQFS